jgi:hypothetical protein
VYFNGNLRLLMRLLEADDINVENVSLDVAFIVNALRGDA